MTPTELAAIVDHTLLKPDADERQYLGLCDAAAANGFFSVCVPPSRVVLARARLVDTGVRVATVVGFPNGYTLAAAKAAEARACVMIGADELDMVIDVGTLKDGHDDVVEADIRGVVEAADGSLVKVIIETCLLNDDEKRRACLASARAGAHFVKTSTGFAGGGATAGDVRLMRETVGDALGVKASGGIKTYDDAMRMIEAGATRLGCSASVDVIKGATR